MKFGWFSLFLFPLGFCLKIEQKFVKKIRSKFYIKGVSGETPFRLKLLFECLGAAANFSGKKGILPFKKTVASLLSKKILGMLFVLVIVSTQDVKFMCCCLKKKCRIQ